MSDEEAQNAMKRMLDEKGFFIKPSHLFKNILKSVKSEEEINLSNLNEKLTAVFKEIEISTIGHESEGKFKGLFDDLDLYSKKLGAENSDRNKKIVKIIRVSKGVDFVVVIV